MRIAVYHNLPSGGAKRTLMEAVRRLAGRHAIDIYTLSSADHDFADLRPFARSHHLFPFRALPLLRSPWGRANQALRALDLYRLRRLTRRIADRIDSGDYDVAFVHPCRYEQSPSLLRSLRRTPSVYYCQEAPRILYEAMPSRPYDDEAIGRRRMLNRLDPLPAMYRRLWESWDRANVRRAGTVLVNSRFMGETVSRIYGITPEVSYHGVDIERFKPMGIEPEDFVFSVGSLTPLKGFDFLIHALAELPAARRPPLVVASNFQNPPERAYLQDLARQRDVSLELVRGVSDDDLARLYNQARVVVYAPIREPFGLVPLEAMACGRPVVAVAEGGILETVLDRHTGLLTERDPRRFAAALAELLDDPPLAERFGEWGREQVESRWTWDRAVATLEAHLRGEDPTSGVCSPVGGPGIGLMRRDGMGATR